MHTYAPYICTHTYIYGACGMYIKFIFIYFFLKTGREPTQTTHNIAFYLFSVNTAFYGREM